MTITLTIEQIEKINPFYLESLKEDEEIMWNKLYNFDNAEYNDKNIKLVRKCGMIPVEVDGMLFVALKGCGMDLTAQIILTKYRLTGFIDSDDVYYLERHDRNYIEYVIGEKSAGELYKVAGIEN
ncbi:MAG: hypothetical protein N3A71_02075 [Candidatus Dojkabacteria bacterium]|nr:hypothetical protein [Candidatus Dojkabacteria bacterium]